MQRDRHQVGNDPVKGEPCWEIQREEPEHEREHHRHHLLRRLLGGVHGRHLGHLLHDPHGAAHKDREEKLVSDGIVYNLRAQIHSQETRVQRNDGVSEGQPGVQTLGEGYESFGRVGDDGPDHLEQADKDRHLQDKRPKAAERVDPGLSEHLELLFLKPLPIVLVLLL